MPTCMFFIEAGLTERSRFAPTLLRPFCFLLLPYLRLQFDLSTFERSRLEHLGVVLNKSFQLRKTVCL